MKRTYETLLRLYPADYRTAFGTEMVATFEEAAADARERGAARSIRFAVVELAGLLAGALSEWTAKLSGRKLTGVSACLSSEAADPEKQIEIAIGRMVHAIANHDFRGARLYSDQEREIRTRLERRA